MTQKELDKIIKKHQHWLKQDCSHWEKMKADFTNQNLRGLNLHGVNLSYVNFSGASLSCADLTDSNFSHAEFIRANLSGARLDNSEFGCASFVQAFMPSTSMCNTDFQCANFLEADIARSCFSRANLSGANFTHAILTRAVLTQVNLCGADFNGAHLEYTKFDECEQLRQGIILEEDLIGYKKLSKGLICKLLIPKGNIVFSINNYKCRTQSAKVLKITDVNGNRCTECAFSIYDPYFIYTVGETVAVKNFNLQYNLDCAEGIHFFRTRERAVAYFK